MAYEYGDMLAPETEPHLDKYVATAQRGYDEAETDLKRIASRELEAEISGRDQQGGLAGYQRMATDQGFTDERDRFEKGLSLKRADLGEDLRQRGQQRLWDVADRDARLYQLRKKAEADRKLKQDEAFSGLLGDIGGGIGTLFGGIAGSSIGGPFGGAVGAGLGGALGGGIGSAI